MTWQRSLAGLSVRWLATGTLAAWALTIGVCVWLVTVPSFDERARIDIVGEVHEVLTPVVMKQRVLDFALRGQTVRFRADARVLREVFHEQAPPKLKPGATARLAVDKTNYAKPFSPEPYRVPTVTIDAMEIDGSKLLTLDVSRQLDKDNRRSAKLVGALAAVCSVFLSWAAVMRLKMSR